MAATSLDDRECAARDANLSALHQAFDQMVGLALRVHLDRFRDAADTAARLGPSVAGAWAGRAVARWGAGRCQARCREADRDCR